MTRILAVDENNDWFLNSSRNLEVYEGIDAVAQSCEQVMKIVVGELIFDIQRGLLSFDQNGVFGNTPDLQLFEFRGRALLNSVPDVTDVVSLEFQGLNNTLTYTAEIETIYGTDTIGSQLFP